MKLVELGIVPDYSTNIEDSATNTILEEETPSNYDISVGKTIGTLNVVENDGQIAIYNDHSHYVLSKKLFEENISVILESLFSEYVQQQKLNGLETLIYIPSSESLHITQYGKIPIIVVEGELKFYEYLITVDGSIYQNGILRTSNNKEIQTDEFPILLTTNTLMTKQYTMSLGNKKINYSQSVPIFAWDNIIIYSDGTITDTTLSWRLKVSNTPLDFLVIQDKLYVLDITGSVYFVNLKTRRVNSIGNAEGASRFYQDGNDVLLCSSDLCYYVKEKSLERLDNRSIENDVTTIYPSIINVRKSAPGVFVDKTFLGTEIVFTYISNNKLRILTDVGTWELTLRK